MAESMRDWLTKEGHTQIFLDFHRKQGIAAGSSWEQILYKQLRQCHAVVALITPDWLASKWCFVEIAQARALGKPIFPIKLIECDSNSVLPDIQHIELTKGSPQGYQQLADGLMKHGVDPMSAFVWDGKRPIYPGLMSFQEDDASLFFGRNKDIQSALDRVNILRRLGDTKFVLLVGPSGSGKSSLLRAGLIPRLRKDPDNWLPVQPFRPQEDALGELALALGETFARFGKPQDWKPIREQLLKAIKKDQPNFEILFDLAKDLKAAANQQAPTILFSIDQAEEFFNFGESEINNDSLNFLCNCLNAGNGAIMVQATLRSDFLGAFQKYASKIELNYETITVSPISVNNFPQIIEGPARLADVKLGDGLVNQMVLDTATEDALPLLAFTLREMYERYANDGILEISEYESLGKLEGSVQRVAQELMEALRPTTEETQALRQALIPALVSISDTGDYVRRRAHWKDLPLNAYDLLQGLVNARLLVSEGNGKERIVEVAHEALFRTWPTLNKWLNEDSDNLRLLEGLRRSANEWEQNQREDDWLDHRGERLEATEEMEKIRHFGDRLSPLERAYLQACIQKRQEESQKAAAAAQAERERREHEAAAERQRLQLEAQAAKDREIAATQITRRTRIGAFVAIFFAVVAGFAGVLAYNNATEAKEAAARARAGQLAALSEAERDENDELSALLAIESIFVTEKSGMGITAEAELALRNSASAIGGIALDVGGGFPKIQFSQNSRWLFISDHGNPERATVWEINTLKQRPQVKVKWREGNVVRDIVFVNSSETVFIHDDAKTRLLDFNEQNPLLKSVSIPSSGPTVALSAIDRMGTWVASVDGVDVGDIWASPVSEIKLWNTKGNWKLPSQVLQDHKSSVTAIKFQENSDFFASADINGTVILWNIESNGRAKRIRTFNIATDLTDRGVTGLQFSPDGAWLAAVSESPLIGSDGAIFLWNLRVPGNSSPDVLLKGHKGSIHLEFSSDSRWIASIGTGAHHLPNINVWLYNLEENNKSQILKLPLQGGSNDIAISPNSRLLAVATDDGLKLWRLSEKRSPQHLEVDQAFEETIYAVEFSPSGRWLVLGGYSSVWLKQVEGPERLTTPIILQGHNGQIKGIAISPDSKLLVTVSNDVTRLWNLMNPQPSIDPIIIPNRGGFQAKNPNGQITDIRKTDPVALAEAYYSKENNSGVTDHELARMASSDEGLQRIPRHFIKEKGPLIKEIMMQYDSMTVSFKQSPSGRWFVIGDGREDKLSLYDIKSDHPLKPVALLTGHKPGLNSYYIMNFSVDEKLLATAHTDDEDLLLWDLTSSQPARNSIRLNGEGSVHSVAFSPTSKYVAFRGKRLILYDIQSKNPVPIPLPNGTFGSFGDTDFTQDGRYVLGVHPWTSGSTIHSVRTLAWRKNHKDLLKVLPSAIGRNMDSREWRRYFPGEQYRLTIPDLPAGPGVWQELLEEAERFVDSGAEKQAHNLYQQIAEGAIKEKDAYLCNLVAWQGTLAGFSKTVKTAAETAVKIAPHDFNYLDTRALNRALNGDRDGAIQDFRQVVQNKANFQEDFIKLRKKWLRVLESGNNPFNRDELSRLREQEW